MPIGTVISKNQHKFGHKSIYHFAVFTHAYFSSFDYFIYEVELSISHPSLKEDLSLKIEAHDQTIWNSTPEIRIIAILLYSNEIQICKNPPYGTGHSLKCPNPKTNTTFPLKTF